MAYRALLVYKGDILIYIGEFGGCCADEEFFELLEKDWENIEKFDIPQWHGMHDRLAIYRRYGAVVHQSKTLTGRD